MYVALLNKIISMCSELGLYSSIDIGALPADGGITMVLGPGAEEETFLDKEAIMGISVIANAKHADQQTCLGALSDIHRYLTRLTEYPDEALFQIIDIRTSSSPNYIGQEDNGQYLYGSILEVKLLSKGVES